MSGQRKPTGRTTPSKRHDLAVLRRNQTMGPTDIELVHPQIHIESCGRDAWVDEGVADLIVSFWRDGIDTLGSCQNVHEWQPNWLRSFNPVAMVSMPVGDYRRLCGLLGIVPGHIDPNAIACMAFFDMQDDRCNWVELGPNVLTVLPEDIVHNPDDGVA